MRIVAEIIACLLCNTVCLILLHLGKYFSPAGEEDRPGTVDSCNGNLPEQVPVVGHVNPAAVSACRGRASRHKKECANEEKRQKRWNWESFQFSGDKVINCLVWAGGMLIQAAVVWKAAAGGADALSASTFIVLAVWLFYIAMIDTKARIIPNRMLLGMLAVRVILWIWKCVQDGLPERGNALYQLIYSVFLLVFLLFVVIVSRGGFGYGDVKFLTVLSLFLDYGLLLSALLTALLGALGVSVYLLMVKKCDRKAAIPFGPFFYFGYIINILIML